MRWFAGTSGYSYEEWNGVFYPQTIAPGAMLARCAQRLPAVEINNTFYRMPRTHVLEGWRDAVPEGFRFVIKAPRRLTHQSRLDDDGGFLAERVATLEDRLGCVLFQLPRISGRTSSALTRSWTDGRENSRRHSSFAMTRGSMRK